MAVTAGNDGGFTPSPPTPDAGVGVVVDAPARPFSDALYAECPAAPPSVRGDGGVWLPDPRAARITCLMTTCDVSRRQTKAELDGKGPPPGWVTWVGGLATATIIGYSVGKLLP